MFSVPLSVVLWVVMFSVRNHPKGPTRLFHNSTAIIVNINNMICQSKINMISKSLIEQHLIVVMRKAKSPLCSSQLHLHSVVKVMHS